jgi:hypothetical protein
VYDLAAMLDDSALPTARRAAERLVGGSSGHAAVSDDPHHQLAQLASVVRFARQKAQSLTLVPDSEPPDWVTQSLVSIVRRQAEGVCLNGCLVGLFLCGPLGNEVDIQALDLAERNLKQRATTSKESVDDVLVSFELNPVATKKSAVEVVTDVMRSLAHLPSSIQVECAKVLTALWLSSVTIAIQARRTCEPASAK